MHNRHGHRMPVVVRDLTQSPPPHVGQAFVNGMYALPEQRTPEQAIAIALSDAFINEFFAADTIVFAVPMHNFGPPSTLKAWIDHISPPARTFTSSSNGPEGLVKGKRTILVPDGLAQSTLSSLRSECLQMMISGLTHH